MRMKSRRLPTPKPGKARRGVILLAVLVSLVLLTLAAYQYADLMNSEFRAANNAHRTVQARLLADSGIHCTAALLSNPDNVNNLLGGNIWNNPQYFYDVALRASDGSGNFGKFTLLAPLDAGSQDSSQGCRHGVMDEAAKINLNVLMQIDPSGARLLKALMALPYMTSEIANSIVDWLDSDSTVRDGGAEDDYYSSLAQPYHCKNGPLESIEELLLVKGVTPQLLFGNDRNHNGIIDPDEDDGSGPYAFGWSAFLTIYSREQNTDPSGNPYFYLNDSDIQTLYQNLSTNVDDGLAKFIILYRQYGGTSTTKTAAAAQAAAAAAADAQASGATPSTPTPSATMPSTTTPSTTTPSTLTGNKTVSPTTAATTAATAQPTGDLSGVELDFTKAAKSKITSIWELVGATVTIPGTQASTQPGTQPSTEPAKPTVVYASPLSDPAKQTSLLPLLFSTTTISKDNEIPARINVNTAPQEVLATLPELTDDMVHTILSARPNLSSSEPPEAVFQTPAWLLTEAKIDPATLMLVDAYISTRSQVYRVQSVGYFDDNGPTARVEAIIDTNGGRPRIVMWRDLTPLGKGWSKTQ